MDKREIRAVIFDLDGTLYAMRTVYKPIFALFCFPNIMHLPHYMKIRTKFQGADFSTGQELHDALCEEFEKKYKVKSADKWIKNTFSTAFVRTLKFMRNRKETPKIIRHLKSKGIKVALFSDFGLIKTRLKALKIDPSLFDIIVSSEDIGALKPARRTFATVAERLNIPCKHILAVGDREDTDGIAAKENNIHFLHVNGKNNSNWHDVVQHLMSL